MTSFRKALLLYNPVSGANLHNRTATMRRIAEIFRRAGVEVLVEPTRARGAAGEQASDAVKCGCDAVFSCGGDGTAFEVLQGMAGLPAMMGVIPLGTGNVLAHDLGLHDRAEEAARQILSFEPRSISLGQIESAGRSRFFTVAAGVGVHAELIYRANAVAKQRGGSLAYYSQGFQLLFRHRFVPLPLEITTSDGQVIQTTALELVAMRVRSFGGPLRLWRPGGSLLSPDLRLVLLRTADRARLMRYALQAFTGHSPYEGISNPDADLVFLSARSVVCHLPESDAERVRVQADGEMLGPPPTKISIIRNGLTLLAPGASWENAIVKARTADPL